MHKIAYSFCSFFLVVVVVSGQNADTVITGTAKDTIIARNWLNQALIMVEAADYRQADSLAARALPIFQTYSNIYPIGYADANYQSGVIYYKESKFDLADTLLQQSLLIYKEHIGEISRKVADTYEIIGFCKQVIQPDSGILYMDKALKIREKLFGPDTIALAPSYLNLGGAYQAAGYADQAIFWYEKVIELIKKHSGDDNEGDVSIFHNLGLIYTDKHELDKGRDYLQKALDMRLRTGNCNDLSNSYLSLCYLESEAGNCDLAIQYGLNGLNACSRQGKKDKVRDAQLYHALGNAALCKGDFALAEDYFTQSLDNLRELLGNTHIYLNIPLNSLATANASGLAHAAEYLSAALDICQKNALSDDYYITCGNLAENYAGQKDFKKAIQFANMALDGLMKAPELHQHEIGTLWQNLGTYHSNTGDLDKGFDCYEKAEEIIRKIYTGPNTTVAHILFNKADNYIRRRYYREADSLLHVSYTMLNQTGRNKRILNALFQDWAEMESAKGNFAIAFSYTDSAIASAGNKLGKFNEGLSEAFLKANVFKGQLCLQYYRQNHHAALLDDARLSFQKAENILQFCQNASLRESDKSALLPYATAISEGIIQIATQFEVKNEQEAFAASEKPKSGLLRAAFRESYAKEIAGIPDSLIMQENTLKVNLTHYEKIQNTLYEAGVPRNDARLLEIQHSIFAIRQKYDLLIRLFENRYPDYHRLKYDLNTETVESVQRDLLQPGQTLLEYFTGDSSIFIFVIRPDVYEVVEVPRDFPLDEWIKSLHAGITGWYLGKIPETQYSASLNQYTQAARNLYQKLIAPVAGFIPKGSQIIVIPDGLLTYIPFEALLTELPTDLSELSLYKYWVLQHDISYCYSATLLREMRDRKHKQEPKLPFLGMAPTFAGDSTPINSSWMDIAQRFGHDALAYNDVEVDSIQRILGGQIYTGMDATEQRFANEAWQYRIVHPSTHGEANDRSGDYSYLAFYETPGDSIENEWLYVREIYNLALNADLVTLSACQTGLGELRRGEGIIGLTRAFTYAGAKSIVNSLWNVDDKRTMMLMVDFYHNLKAGQRKDAALAAAKRSFILHGDSRAHPYFWAGFIGIGDMRPVEFK